MNDLKTTAEILKVAAHPARLEILQRLRSGVLCVSDMEDILGISQSNMSQHLSMLRRSGLVDYYVDGRLRCYFLKDPRSLDIVGVLEKEYASDLPAPACCPVKVAHSRS